MFGQDDNQDRNEPRRPTVPGNARMRRQLEAFGLTLCIAIVVVVVVLFRAIQYAQ